MDLIEQAINVLEAEIANKQNTVTALRALLNDGKAPKKDRHRRWTPAQRKAQSLRATRMWRKRKAAAVQNRVKVTKVAAKKG